MKREKFQSRIGFLLVSAGCAIGIGNVWRFPYVAGQNGGGIFVLFYLIFLLCMGVPILTMELAMGRSTKQSALKAYKALEKPNQKWHIHGYLCMLGNYMLMLYYTTVSGWMLSYFFKFLRGEFSNSMSNTEISQVFDKLLDNPVEMCIWMAVSVFAGIIVCRIGLQNGLEKITKVMMSALLVLIVLLVGHSFVLPAAKDGFSFILLPNFEVAKEVGLRNIITAAMNQAFFTLSLGMGSMQIFGSYMSKDNTLVNESLCICILDTFVALMSALIIFPACFSFGVTPDAGPSLIFVTLPNVFVNMSGGRIWGMLFFMFMTFASFSTVIAVFENIIASCIDNFDWSRKKSCILNLFIILIGSLPCVFGFNVLSHIQISGLNILDMEDFLVSNIILPFGSLIFLLFCVTKWGWNYDNYVNEVNTGKGLRFPKWFKYYFRFILPILIFVIIINGLV